MPGLSLHKVAWLLGCLLAWLLGCLIGGWAVVAWLVGGWLVAGWLVFALGSWLLGWLLRFHVSWFPMTVVSICVSKLRKFSDSILPKLHLVFFYEIYPICQVLKMLLGRVVGIFRRPSCPCFPIVRFP